jgi:hypothetical protein
MPGNQEMSKTPFVQLHQRRTNMLWLQVYGNRVGLF